MEQHRAQLERLCERFSVRRLDLVGSGTGAAFREGSSDLDFLVTFQELSPREHARCYFGLLEELEDLFLIPVDLIEERAIRNELFRASLQESRVPVYGQT